MCTYQLVCDGLSFAGLTSDNNVLKSALSTVRFARAWVERNERMIEEIDRLFRNVFCEQDKLKKLDYVT